MKNILICIEIQFPSGSPGQEEKTYGSTKPPKDIEESSDQKRLAGKKTEKEAGKLLKKNYQNSFQNNLVEELEYRHDQNTHPVTSKYDDFFLI